MDRITTELAAALVAQLRQTPPDTRLIVGVAGSPASGKSSFCHRLVSLVNDSAVPGDPAPAVLVGLDGWHLSRAQLDALPDPRLAHERRGAHWTFDGPGYVAFVQALRGPAATVVVKAPTFSHALKDPAPDALAVHPHHRLVVIEGLYAFLAIEPWRVAAELLDERWFLRVEEAEALRRLVKRHVETGICPDEETARQRAEGNDIPNGKFVVENMLEPTRFIESIDDPVMAHELV
ncbi:unnamed protein product [Mycena citricolor]|uniref:Phosphoribulokinase/uridine kinase domain-containing protein n=1 Tax=Mycena citricolor TaxID=2018698 RepID=A0AAD2HUE2_9AGAR|nr:unnamed protein product [Mycena citricolor]